MQISFAHYLLPSSALHAACNFKGKLVRQPCSHHTITPQAASPTPTTESNAAAVSKVSRELGDDVLVCYDE